MDEKSPAMQKIDVVIPLYNKVATVQQTIASVLAQDYADFHLFIVDDGSTDGSVECLAGIDDPRLTIVRQANLGPGAARNRGAAMGTAPLLAFLDADDEWEPGYLRTAADRLAGHPVADAHVSAHFLGPERTSTEEDHLRFGMREGVWRIDDVPRGATRTKRYVDFFLSSCVVVRRHVFERYGGFYENRCTYGEDTYLWINVALNHNVYFDPKPAVWFHTEHSELGVARRGNHPIRPVMLAPEQLREQCSPHRLAVLEDLLAGYRVMEVEKLERKFPGSRPSLSDILRRGVRGIARRVRSRFLAPHVNGFPGVAVEATKATHGFSPEIARSGEFT
jgi:glycosyltransferase involved in cell wall biosynthesis